MQFKLLELAWVLGFFLAKKGLVTPKTSYVNIGSQSI